MTGMTAKKFRTDRKAVLSVPIFHLKREAGRMSELEPYGVLSLDTSTPLSETGWLDPVGCRRPVELMIKWADVISYILNGSL